MNPAMDLQMFGDGVLLGSICSVTAPFFLAVFVGMKSKRVWIKAATLLVCLVLSFILYVLFAIAWALSHPGSNGGQSVFNTFVRAGLSHIVITLVLMMAALWRIPKIVQNAMSERLKLQHPDLGK